MVWTRLLAALALGSICSGVLIENVADLTKLNLTFDYIVVGGARLSSSGKHAKYRQAGPPGA